MTSEPKAKPPIPKLSPPYWIPLTTRVPEAQGLSHFADVHIWSIKATGAKTAIQAAAYPNATLDSFHLDHLDLQSQTAGTIADAKDWTLADNTIKTTDGSKFKLLAPGEAPPKEATAFGDHEPAKP